MSTTRLYLTNTIIIPSIIESNRVLFCCLPESLKQLDCDPDSLSYFIASALHNVKELTLRISDFIDESDPCWEKISSNLENLYLKGRLSNHEVVANQMHNQAGGDHKPLKIGGITIPKRVQGTIHLQANLGIQGNTKFAHIDYPIRYCLDKSDESRDFNWGDGYDDGCPPLYMTIAILSKTANLKVSPLWETKLVTNNCIRQPHRTLDCFWINADS
ncbi:unnamed protein product [Ambrosiozyma monospora]|uniref:Unnamed protein product n=1 Tax=Ambrosiozyma monospora TaxID=43982 RepID=A0ACB5T2K7_AMBMO|nr:unnamed protein product [Ambrosiozyma monospora]